MQPCRVCAREYFERLYTSRGTLWPCPAELGEGGTKPFRDGGLLHRQPSLTWSSVWYLAGGLSSAYMAIIQELNRLEELIDGLLAEPPEVESGLQRLKKSFPSTAVDVLVALVVVRLKSR